MYLNGFLVKSTLPFNRHFLSLRWHSACRKILMRSLKLSRISSQLFNKEGHTFTYDEFLSGYNISVPPREFGVVLDAILSGLKMLLCSVSKDTNHIHTPELFIGHSDPFLSTKTNDKHTREIIQWGTISRPASVLSFFGIICIVI